MCEVFLKPGSGVHCFLFCYHFCLLRVGQVVRYKKQGRENYKYQSGIEYDGYRRRGTNPN